MNGESGKRKMIVDDFGVNLVCSGLGVNIPIVDDCDDVVVINCGSNFFSSIKHIIYIHFYFFYKHSNYDVYAYEG